MRRFPTAVGFATWQGLFRQEFAALLLRQDDLDEAQYQVTAAIFLIEDLMQVSTEPILEAMTDEAYETLDRIFVRDGTPLELLPGRKQLHDVSIRASADAMLVVRAVEARALLNFDFTEVEFFTNEL